jgi:hypothetical protein
MTSSVDTKVVVLVQMFGKACRKLNLDHLSKNTVAIQERSSRTDLIKALLTWIKDTNKLCFIPLFVVI